MNSDTPVEEQASNDGRTIMSDDQCELEAKSESGENEEDEDVMAMVMAEKTNAFFRGKSSEFDRTFVPRIIGRIAPSDVTGNDEQPEGEEHSSRRIVFPSGPGAFSVDIHSTSQIENISTSVEPVDRDEPMDYDDVDKTIVIPRASLVGTSEIDLDVENVAYKQSVPMIAEVVRSDEFVQNSSAPNEKERRKKIFRCAVLAGLLLIAAVLIAILVVQVTNRDEDDHRRGDGRPKKPHPDKYPYGNTSKFDDSFSPFEKEMDQNDTMASSDFEENEFGG
ncbi:hypothetical protein IV203_001703 [Nitzschia inconspicua]|uniref:Uncharacterized protein n=1 Tax=Nitzschia inconspicua TaxID=303405 RepID=A0A9K3L8R2_9STRA|nr:hypothetical protein IV203_001703 [Nitzschia inconspicua]